MAEVSIKNLAFLILTFIAFVSSSPSSSSALNEAYYNSSDILDYDVCVIGGGAAGTYTAIRLRDKGKKVAVVEIKNRLGGHTQTYRDPASNATVDIGVVVFDNLQIVRDYFGRFGVPLIVNQGAGGGGGGVVSKSVDFRTGEVVPGYTSPNATAAIAAYAAQVAKYPEIEQSLGKVPDPVPADLLLPFGDFVTKYSLQDAVPTIAQLGQGFGNILNLPTLYIIKYFGSTLLASFQIGLLSTARGDNSELYEKAQAELGKDALLSSSVVAMDRSSPKVVKVLVKTPTGKKLIRAKKLVSTIPPLLQNLHSFDLDAKEVSIFQKFKYHGYYVGILNNSEIPDNLSLGNVGLDTPYHLPALPAVYGISPTRAPGQHLFQFGTKDGQCSSNAEVKAEVIATLDRLRAAGTIQGGNTTARKPGFSIFANHTPYELYVTSKEIAKGFYRKLFSLQGRKHTYWTGAAFVAHDSALIWTYTETLVSKIAA